MIYTVPLIIPANTLAASPARVNQSVAPGVIEQVFITFPDGCAGLVGARIVIREHIVWPTNPDVWFVNNNYTFAFTARDEIDPPGEMFRFEGYNNDRVYQHTPIFTLVVLPKEGNALLSALLARPVLASELG